MSGFMRLLVRGWGVMIGVNAVAGGTGVLIL